MRGPHSQITWIRANNLHAQGYVPSVFALRLRILQELHPAPLHPQGLRKVLFGDASRVFSRDWAQAHFRFREPHSDLAYALEADKVMLQCRVFAPGQPTGCGSQRCARAHPYTCRPAHTPPAPALVTHGGNTGADFSGTAILIQQRAADTISKYRSTTCIQGQAEGC